MMYLHKTRLRIEKAVYKQGINVALYNVENSKKYKAFKKQVERALNGQVKFVAQYKTHLPLLISLAKAQDPVSPLLSQVGALVGTRSIGGEIDLSAFLTWAGTQGGQAALDKLGIDGIFGLKNQALIDYFKNYTNLRIKTVDNYTKKWIAESIQEGKDQGLTPFQIQQKLIDEGKAINALRAERIVLTETQAAMTRIEIEASKRYGIQQHTWRTSVDERVCPICAPLEGDTVSVGANFDGGFDGPPAHVSCRCSLEQVIPDQWLPPEKVWLGQ